MAYLLRISAVAVLVLALMAPSVPVSAKSRFTAKHSALYSPTLTVIAENTEADVYVSSPLSASYATFEIEFSVIAEDGDIYIPDSTNTSGNVGATFAVYGTSPFTGQRAQILISDAPEVGDYYLIEDGEEETFKLIVTLNPDANGSYMIGLTKIGYVTAPNSPSFTTHVLDQDDDDYQGFETDKVYIPDSFAPTTVAVTDISPNQAVAGSGAAFSISFNSENVPEGATVCTSLIRQGTGEIFGFPGNLPCREAQEGHDVRMGELLRTPGYDLGPGVYNARVQIWAPSGMEKDGRPLAEAVSTETLTLVEPAPITTTVTVTNPLNDQDFVANSGTSYKAHWVATDVPAGATTCGYLMKAGYGPYASFGCGPAKNGTNTGTVRFTYEIPAGVYFIEAVIVGPSNGGKEGPLLARDRSERPIVVVNPMLKKKPPVLPRPTPTPPNPTPCCTVPVPPIPPVTPPVLPPPTPTPPPAPSVQAKPLPLKSTEFKRDFTKELF